MTDDDSTQAHPVVGSSGDEPTSPTQPTPDSPAPVTDISTPTMLGERYQIEEILGRGGMAEVHEAKDLRLGRRVAVKILRPDLAKDETFHQRFEREAHSAAGLNHPNIVAVYDTGKDVLGSGAAAVTVPYIVMEHVDGVTLRQLLSSGRRLLPERALEITSGTLSALDYSHRHGIVHRDIKPANIMLNRSGEVKVMDFGIARALAAQGQTMTATSQVMGTAQYLSPEQARGEVVDARSDLYSTGCVLYELLTGRPPFMGESPVSVAYQHVSESPTHPSELDSQVTPQVDAVVMRALAKNPDERYQSASEFKADVDRAIIGAPVTAPVPVVAGRTASATTMMPPVGAPAGAHTTAPPKRRGWMWAAIIMGVVVLGAGTVALAQTLFGQTAAEQVTVPSVIDQSVSEAEATLTDVGLRLGQQKAVASDKEPDTVLSQDPVSGESLEKGQAVNVTVSGGPGQVVVPNVVGLTSPDEAKQALEAADLKLGNVEPKQSDEPTDFVLSQSPNQGTSVEVGTEINISVSNGQVEVPNVVGGDESSARKSLGDVGLKVATQNQPSSEPVGTVISQSPNAGNTVGRGSTVSIVISSGQPTSSSAQPALPPPTPDRQGQSAPPTNPNPTPTKTGSSGGNGNSRTSGNGSN